MQRVRVLTAALLLITALAACTPTYDWRDVRGKEAPYGVLLPGKPSTHAKEVNLGGIRATMTMTAAQVDNVTFAVATAELPSAAQAQAALLVMKQTMVSNIGGVVRMEKSESKGGLLTINLIAESAARANSDAKALHARFVARDRRVYQVIVLGSEKLIQIDAVDTFLGSFKSE